MFTSTEFEAMPKIHDMKYWFLDVSNHLGYVYQVQEVSSNSIIGVFNVNDKSFSPTDDDDPSLTGISDAIIESFNLLDILSKGNDPASINKFLK